MPNLREAEEQRESFKKRGEKRRLQGTGNVVIEDGLCALRPPASAACNTSLGGGIVFLSLSFHEKYFIVKCLLEFRKVNESANWLLMLFFSLCHVPQNSSCWIQLWLAKNMFEWSHRKMWYEVIEKRFVFPTAAITNCLGECSPTHSYLRACIWIVSLKRLCMLLNSPAVYIWSGGFATLCSVPKLVLLLTPITPETPYLYFISAQTVPCIKSQTRTISPPCVVVINWLLW